MWSCVVVGIIMSALFLIFMDPIIGIIGASAETWDLRKHILQLYVIQVHLFLLQTVSQIFFNILRAEGQSGKAMMGQVLGNLTNIVLDPIMILTLGWNISGAAIARESDGRGLFYAVTECDK